MSFKVRVKHILYINYASHPWFNCLVKLLFFKKDYMIIANGNRDIIT